MGQGDWDEHRKRVRAVTGASSSGILTIPVQQANNTAIGIAILCFYVLDFALNGLQASLRNLLLDVTPPNQLNAGNAWHGRMVNAGNIIGYGFGTTLFLLYGRKLVSDIIVQDSCLWQSCPSSGSLVVVNSGSSVSFAPLFWSALLL